MSLCFIHRYSIYLISQLMNRIKLSDLRNGTVDWQLLSNVLEQSVPNTLLVNSNNYEIVRECLLHINFRKTEKDISTLTKQASQILKFTPYRTNEIEPNKIFTNFINVFLGYKGTPFFYKQIIENEVKKDFTKLNDLIKYYRTMSFIILYEAEDATPRNHEDRTLLVFFKRALNKREQVIELLYDKIDNLSLNAAKRSFYNEFIAENEAMDIIHSSTYYPYRESFLNPQHVNSIDYELLDHRLINPFRNKTSIQAVLDKIDTGCSTSDLNSILLQTKLDPYIEYILTATDTLPGISKRKNVFEEIKYVFSKKKWYALYALALPQIEGLFSDIISIAFPRKSMSGTLTDKVDYVRPLYSLSEKFFDYYQYYLPTQRNRFAHAGYDTDIIPKSYHCIFDLWFLIDAFYNLNIPLLQVIRILNKGKLYFENIGNLSKFIHLIKEVDQTRGFVDKEDSIKMFANDLFSTLIDFDKFLEALQIDFNKALLRFSENFSEIVYSCTNEYLSLKSISKAELIKRMEHVKNGFDKGIYPLEDDIKLLLDTNNFIRNIRSIFKDELLSIVPKTDAFYNANKIDLDKIELINPERITDYKISEYFMFPDSNEWEHVKILL